VAGETPEVGLGEARLAGLSAVTRTQGKVPAAELVPFVDELDEREEQDRIDAERLHGHAPHDVADWGAALAMIRARRERGGIR
jgi:hypothetical protein